MTSTTINSFWDDWTLPIFTPRLIIRPPEIKDAVALNQARNNSLPELSVFMSSIQHQETLNETIEFIKEAMANWILKDARYPFLPFLIFNHSLKLVGVAGFHYYNWLVPCLEIGYWCNTAYSRQGYITEAVNALTRYSLNYLKCRRVTIACDITNNCSRKIPERLGYQTEAILRSNIVTPGTGLISDTVYYACFSEQSLPNLNVYW